MNMYYSRDLNEMQYQTPALFGSRNEKDNYGIAYIGMDTQKPFSVLSINTLVGLNFLSPASGSQCFCFYRYDETGKKIENITEWGLNQFVKQYGKKGINKETIFQYVYSVLHNPSYRKKYELNLKREFPRIPFYSDFKKWSEWGKALMDLHIKYESVKPFELEETTIKEIKNPKCKLKADKDSGYIYLDEASTLSGIPAEAWDYKLGSRSALEWILDQFKEDKPKDPTILEKFNTFKFADYKEHVINLLKRVCTVSVETMKIIAEMEKTKSS